MTPNPKWDQLSERPDPVANVRGVGAAPTRIVMHLAALQSALQALPLREDFAVPAVEDLERALGAPVATSCGMGADVLLCAADGDRLLRDVLAQRLPPPPCGFCDSCRSPP